MRLVSFNIRSGRCDDDRADPDRLATELAALDADVLVLQEVDRWQPRSGGVDQVAVAARACQVAGRGHVRFEPTVTGTTPRLPGADGRPAYGLAVLSRHPVRLWRRITLPRLRVPVPWAAARGAVRLVRDEPRVAVAAVLAAPGSVRTVVTTHLSYLPGVNALQLRALARALRDLPAPVILAGDLNLPGAVPTGLLRGWHSLGGPATFPAGDPRVRLDHALVRDHTPRPPSRVSAVHSAISDHRALVVELGPAATGPRPPR